MKTALTVVFIIASILLIILVLMQEGKEAGLGSLTGATESGTYWSKNKGRSKEGTLIRITTVLTIIFFVTAAILCSKFI
ncbi:preprotein translocase subunit SecG [Anaerostipes sp. MSJ-23]|uniref:preprotein translocase subunit SecG n=2 Tax=unclassified Anaerostipes TaxID=2635253 RepID=UPI001C120028|nr:preprotein translocase subunit SecG [Anaerostipes sp. MSJ-23]